MARYISWPPSAPTGLPPSERELARVIPRSTTSNTSPTTSSTNAGMPDPAPVWPPTGQLPGYDERRIAAMLILRSGASLTSDDHKLCRAATLPGAGPLGWRDKLRLAVLVSRLLGRAAS